MNPALERLRALLPRHGVEAFLVTNAANRRYISGFDGTAGCLLVGREEAFLVTDSRYREQAEAQAPQFEVLLWRRNLAATLARIIRKQSWKRVAFEAKDVSYSFYREMTRFFPGELVPLESALEELRRVKSDREIKLLRQGAALLDRGFNYLLEYLKPGLTEQEVVLELEYFLRRQGAQEAAFRFIVASGQRGSMPHGVASGKRLQQGELVTIDFGVIYQGYASDMTRTLALGSADRRQRQVYQLVYRAQQAAREGIKAGMSAAEADRLAREIIDGAGLGGYFGHGLGHGVGLETHERPVLSPLGKEILEPGMVVTIEPGVYIPGWGGVRIEDMVLIGRDRGETLNSSPRELIII